MFNAHGRLFQPKNGHDPAWPRYNRLKGRGNDSRFNKVGNHGYGAYGENVGIGNIDDDPALEIITTFDNHQINAFNDDGTSVRASKWFTNPESGRPRVGGWAGGSSSGGLDPRVEKRHYHRHSGRWPSPARQPWLQWTDSPPVVADLDGDGRNEVIGLPNVERHIPYRTQGYAFMALDGAYGDGHRSARRHRGFEHPKMSNHPVYRPSGDGDPRRGIRHRPWSTSPATHGPRSSRPFPAARCTPWGRAVTASGPRSTHRGGRRRSPPRSSPPTSTRTAGPSWSSAPTPCTGTPDTWSSSTTTATRSRSPGCVTSVVTATASVSRSPVDRRPHRERHARDRAHDVRPRRRRVHGARLAHGLPTLAHWSRQPPPQRDEPVHRTLTWTATVVEERALRASPGG